MLGWLKKITQYKPAPVKVTELEAKLTAPDGSRTLWGEVEYDAYEDGGWKLETEIEHPKGAPDGPFELYFDGRLIKSIEAHHGHDTEFNLVSGHHELAVVPNVGMQVELRGPAGVLLTGTFQMDH